MDIETSLPSMSFTVNLCADFDDVADLAPPPKKARTACIERGLRRELTPRCVANACVAARAVEVSAGIDASVTVKVIRDAAGTRRRPTESPQTSDANTRWNKNQIFKYNREKY